jgi:hypothetical protein
MHTIETRIMGYDARVLLDGARIVVELDSCDGVDMSSDVTLYEVEHAVFGQIYRAQTMHHVHMITRVIPCESCGRNRNHDTSTCGCPGCEGFSTVRPCQYACHCA